MENKIIFHPNIDDDPEDFTRLQDFAEASLDHVVADAITSQSRYSGFAVAKTAPTQVTVQTGRLYSGGKVYASGTTAWIKEFVSVLPIAGKKVAVIVTWGSEADTDVRPRQFLINAETRQAQADSVPLVHARIANLDAVVGQEAPDPTAPIVAAGYTVIAYVTLSPTGVDSVVMNADTELTGIDDLEGRVEDLEDFEAAAGFQIRTIASDLAGIKANQVSVASRDEVSRTLQRLAVLEAKNGIASTAVDSDANFFLETSKSQLDDPLSHVKVEEGIRFPAAAEGVSALQIFNPLDPFAVVKNGVMLPAYDREAWLLSGSVASGEAQIASYSQTSFDFIQKTMSRQRVRYGEQMTVCTNSLWWQTGRYDSARNVFTKDGETWSVELVDTTLGPQHYFYRVTKLFVDTWEEPYWEKITNTITVPGAQIAETWLQGQDMWLDAVGIWFSRLAAAGSVHVAIVEVSDYGLPNLKQTIASTTVLRENLQLNENVIPLQPTFLQGGKRYALVVTTAADHWVYTVPGQSFTSGTFFYVLDGAYAQGDATRDLMFRLYRCKFRQQRAVITLNPLQLSGGILLIDLLAPAIVPDSTSLSYEIQVGSTWYNLNDVNTYILGQGGTVPPLLPFRAVFNGSVDCMPALSLLDSQVKVARPDVNARHISKTRTLPGSSTQIRVMERYEYWDAAYHTASCQLRTGSDFSTVATPSSTSTVTNDDGSIERTYVFNLGAGVTQFRKDTQIATTSNQKTFHVAWQKDWAL